jgi:hypothetical protein
MSLIEYRVISETDGWITEYNNKKDAERFAQEANEEHGLPADHYVERHKIQ